MDLVRTSAVFVHVAAVMMVSSASASTIVLSTHSSDLTPASQFDATIDFAVGEFDGGNLGDELKITLTNPSFGAGGDALFNINAVYWNVEANVLDLANSGIEIRLSSMASFQPDGELYDGSGIQPDTVVDPKAHDFLHRGDELLHAAFNHLVELRLQRDDR